MQNSLSVIFLGCCVKQLANIVGSIHKFVIQFANNGKKMAIPVECKEKKDKINQTFMH